MIICTLMLNVFSLICTAGWHEVMMTGHTQIISNLNNWFVLKELKMFYSKISKGKYSMFPS